MNIADLIVSRARLMLTTAMLLSLVGLGAWLTMPREEDPRIPPRASIVVVPYPGADAETVERLIIQPLEDELASVDSIKKIWATARPGMGVMTIELQDSVYDVEPVWDSVQDKIDTARQQFPAAVLEPHYDREMFDQESIVIAVTGSENAFDLKPIVDDLEDRLHGISEVKRVILTADPGQQITITLDPAMVTRLGLDPRMIAGLLESRNSVIPGGDLVAGGRIITVDPGNEFRSIDEIRNTKVPLPSGAAIPLSELASVTLTEEQPVMSRMRFNGRPAVALGIVPRSGIDLVKFGEKVDEVVRETEAEIAPYQLDYVAFQPSQVDARLKSLNQSLLASIAVVVLFLFIFMGLRLGLTVAAVVPLVALSTLAIYHMGGGVLHQMSIAAMVLALGMLVDNAICVAEDIQARLDRGATRWDAAREAVRTLAIPLGSATGTTVAAFVPMLLTQGPTGDFTRALPVVIILTLVISYVFAVAVTPPIAAFLLKRSTTHDEEPASPILTRISTLSVRHPWAIVALTLVLLGAAFSLAPQIRSQFFPTSDRNQIIIDLTLPEGATLDETTATVIKVEEKLSARPEVVSVASFSGRGVPHFYYNLIHRPHEPNLSQLVVTTRNLDDVVPLIEFVRSEIRRDIPGVEIVGRRIEQGPPVTAPVEFRVAGTDLAHIQKVADTILAELRATPGAVDVRHGLGTGIPTLVYDVDEAVAARHQLTGADVAVSLLHQTRGIPAGQYRAERDPIPMVIRGPDGQNTDPAQLMTANVSKPGATPTPLAQLAVSSVEWKPAAIHRLNRERYTSVLAQLEPGYTYSDILAVLQPKIDALEIPGDVRVTIGGEAEGSGDANAALLTTVPAGFVLLLFFLMSEFNSFRAVFIVLVTIPLSAVGVIPGLVFANQPFGFMSLLGLIALGGIVVNNAIILLDLIGARRAEGASIDEAISSSVAQRTRPIFLTTGTTVMGMLPLAVSASTMWPPLAWSMVSGLMASTFLTILVIPSLYRLMYRDDPRTLDRVPAANASMEHA